MSATATLADLCELVTQQVDPTGVDPGLPYLGLEHLAPGRMTAMTHGRAGDVQSHKFAFRQGDVLYGKLRPYLDKAVLAEHDGVCTTELLVLRPKPGIDRHYLACVVHAPGIVEHAMSGVTGAHHPRTSWSHISRYAVQPLDEPEQKSVAALMWRLHHAIAACLRGEQVATQLKHSAMRELFTRGLRCEPQEDTEIGLAPASWEVRRLEDDHDIAGGGTPLRSVDAYWAGGTIPWVKTGEVNYSVIRSTEEHITQAGMDNSSARLLPPGTLLIAMFGQGVTRGRVAILGIEATCNQACAAVRPRNDRVDTRFLYHLLTSKYEELRQLAHGGQQQNLNIDIVRNFRVAVPSTRDEQQEIVAILDAIDRKVDLHRRKKAVLEELFKSVLHKLMTGEVRVADLDLSALPALEEAHS